MKTELMGIFGAGGVITVNVKEDVKPTGHWGTYLLIFFLW